MSTPLTTIYTWFQTGDFPTETQFQQTFSSFFHKEETIPYTAVEGLDAKFNLMLLKSVFDSHIIDNMSHSGYLAMRTAENLTTVNVNSWKAKLGIGYVATIDGQNEPGNVYSKPQIDAFINMLNLQDDEHGDAIDLIREMLLSNDLNLDEMQEIVGYIKENRADIDALQAIAIGVTTDDKVKLLDDFVELNSPVTQQDFNNSISTMLLDFVANNDEMVAVITTSANIPHNFATDKLIVQVRDSVTGKSMLCEDYATSTHVQINFLDDVPNPCNVLIKKISA